MTAIEVRVRTTAVGSHQDAALVLMVGPDENVRRTVNAVGRAYAGAWDTLKAGKSFTGAAGQVRVLIGGSKDRIPVLVLAGTGPQDGAEAFRRAAAGGARAARDAGATSVTLALPSGGKPWHRADRAAEAVTEGALVGLYRFTKRKSEPPKTAVERLTILAPRGEGRRAEKGAASGRILGEGIWLARDLGNEPGNVATPTFLEETAQRIADDHGLGLRVLDEDEMRDLGMGSLLGVSQGSAQPAKLIILTYEPPRRGKVDTVALVGKGLTFDAGGISIKPAAKMEDMKFDMCGGAAVLAGMETIARLRVPVRVVGVVPASENLLGAEAYKPGDILKAMNGTTIEVRNTDAEGRLILADALCYTTTKLRPKPKAVIDFATLTGACVVALGDQNAGLLSNDEKLAGRISTAGDAAGDPVWRLPLTDGYRQKLESPYADVSNLGSPGAGTITAAAFLEKFVGKTAWAHVDIAGMAWTERRDGYLTKGATGFGVALIGRLLRDWPRSR